MNAHSRTSDFAQSRAYQEDGELVMVNYGTFTEEPEPETIVEEAVRITSGDRNDDYGPPEVDLRHIGRKWAATISARVGIELDDLEPDLVALLMIDLKTVRAAHKPKRDSLVDVIGWSICADRCAPDPS